MVGKQISKKRKRKRKNEERLPLGCQPSRPALGPRRPRARPPTRVRHAAPPSGDGRHAAGMPPPVTPPAGPAARLNPRQRRSPAPSPTHSRTRPPPSRSAATVVARSAAAAAIPVAAQLAAELASHARSRPRLGSALPCLTVPSVVAVAPGKGRHGHFPLLPHGRSSGEVPRRVACPLPPPFFPSVARMGSALGSWCWCARHRASPWPRPCSPPMRAAAVHRHPWRATLAALLAPCSRTTASPQLRQTVPPLPVPRHPGATSPVTCTRHCPLACMASPRRAASGRAVCPAEFAATRGCRRCRHHRRGPRRRQWPPPASVSLTSGARRPGAHLSALF